MKYSESKPGRIFTIRLEDGDIIHESIEQFCRQKAIKSAALMILGGADKGSKLIVGPKDGRAQTISPMEYILQNVHEVTGTGTIFPDDNDNPTLHMHIACGRKDSTITGCVRSGVKVWHIMEIILFELLDSTGVRLPDTQTGFKLLTP